MCYSICNGIFQAAKPIRQQIEQTYRREPEDNYDNPTDSGQRVTKVKDQLTDPAHRRTESDKDHREPEHKEKRVDQRFLAHRLISCNSVSHRGERVHVWCFIPSASVMCSISYFIFTVSTH